MTPERWKQIDAAAAAALEAPPEQRSAVVDRLCAGDDELRRAVLDLISECDSLDGFLDHPVPAIAALADAASEPQPATVGARGGAYTVVGVIASGGMGVVYEAEQASPRRTVALKLIRPGLATPALVRRFEYEAQILGQLHHPGIAQIYEAGTEDFGSGPQPFLAMELVRGRPLTDYARAHGLTVRQRLELVARVCDAVHHAHQRGIIHRDLKPANILVDENGQPKVVDFGIARSVEASSDAPGGTAVTSAGQIVGTLAYMSPEQLGAGGAEVDTRTDVYSLGVVLYELLAERPPLDLSTLPLHEAARLVVEKQPLRLGAVVRSLRGDVETIVGKAMEKQKERRYGSAAALADDIRRFLNHQPIAARPPAAVYYAARFARRHRALVATAAAAAVLLAAGVAGIAIQARRAINAEWLAQARLRAGNAAMLKAEMAQKEAEARRREAEEALARAQRDAESLANLNLFFLTNILESAFPGRAGPSVTVIEAVDAAAADIPVIFRGDPLTEARVRHYIGNVYQEIGRYADAEHHLCVASELWASELGITHPESITTDSWLVRLLRRSGRLEESEALARDVVLRARVAFPDRPWRVAAELWQLARTRRMQGDLAEAEALLRETLALNIPSLGPAEQGTFAVADELIDLLLSQGRRADADAVYPAIGAALVHYALPEEKAEAARHAEYRLADLYARTGRSEKAEAILRDVHARMERTYGSRDLRTAWATVLLARLLNEHQRGEPGEAVSLMRSALEARSEALGFDSPSAAGTLAQVALCLAGDGRLDEALDTALEAHQMEAPRRAANRFRVSRTALPLARVHIARGELAEAEDILRREYELRLRVRGPLHASTGEVALRLAQVIVKQGRAAEAEPILRSCLRVEEIYTWQQRWQRAVSQIMLAACLDAQGRAAEAAPLIAEAAPFIESAAPANTGPERDLLESIRRHLDVWPDALDFRSPLGMNSVRGGATD